MQRSEFTVENLPEIGALLAERVKQVADNFGDDNYPEESTRKINIGIEFIPRKDDPSLIDIRLSSDVKLPKRKAKPVYAAIAGDGRIVIDRPPQDESLFTDAKVTLFPKGDVK